MVKKALWVVLAGLSVMIGIYPAKFLTGDKKAGILNIKPEELFLDPFWRVSFYVHITLGGLALLIGWLQFSSAIRRKRAGLHRLIGKLYVPAALLSALCGFNIACHATGGLPAALGFMSLSAAWFYTTLMAYLHVRRGQIAAHRNMMFYSYACCFAAVTLRLWLPLLVRLFGDFETAYRFVAWWCWVSNLAVAYWLTRRLGVVAPEKG